MGVIDIFKKIGLVSCKFRSQHGMMVWRFQRTCELAKITWKMITFFLLYGNKRIIRKIQIFLFSKASIDEIIGKNWLFEAHQRCMNVDNRIKLVRFRQINTLYGPRVTPFFNSGRDFFARKSRYPSTIVCNIVYTGKNQTY